MELTVKRNTEESAQIVKEVNDLMDAIELKRGRGRPAVAHPLSQAERAKIYRLRKKSKESVSVPGRLKGDVEAMTNFQTENLRVALDNANEQIRVLQARLAIKSDATKTADYFERWRLQDAAEIKLLSGDVSSLREKNELLVAERDAAWKEVDRLKSAAPQSELSREFISNCESAEAYLDAVFNSKK